LTHCLGGGDRLALVFSPTERQSREYCRYVRRYARALGHPVGIARQNLNEVEWANGSRLLSLPDNHEGVVGFTPTRIVIDEASRVSDVLYLSLRPMLATGGEIELLSTPFGKRGFFFEIFNTPARLAAFGCRHRVTWRDVRRITPEFIAEERLELGERWFRQEWETSFEDAVDAVFAADAVRRAACDDPETAPLFGTRA